MKNFSIVIPIHNEEKILASQIRRLNSSLGKITKGYEILLVENGSNDQTDAVASRLAKKYKRIRAISLDYPSYGEAIKEGVHEAKYNTVARFDIEFWNVGFLKHALNLLETYDIVVGSKNLPTSDDKRPLGKKLLSRAINGFLRSLFAVPFTDTHGLKIFRKKSLVTHLNAVKSPNHFFESEFLVRAYYTGHKIKEIPVGITELRKTRFPFNKRFFEALSEMLNLILYKRYIIKNAITASQRRLWA